MRLKIAVALVILGLLAMGAGVGQRTIWAPGETVTTSVSGDFEDAPLTVLDPNLNDRDGEVQVTVKGEGELMLAVGRADDVEAWVGGAAHLTIQEQRDRKLVAERADGAMEVPDPRDSDMWQNVETGEGEITYTWADPAPGQWSLLLASDGTKPAPADVSLTVPNNSGTPWAIPLIVIGALLTVLGLAMLFGPKKGRRAAEPAPGTRAARRQQEGRNKGRAGAGAVRRSTHAATAGILSLALAGGAGGAALATNGTAGPDSGADGSETSQTSPDGGYPVLLESQLQEIVDSVANTVKAADAGKDAKELRSRVAGPAFELRKSTYEIQSKNSDYERPAPISATPILAHVVTSTYEWPRTVVAVTQSKASEVPQAMVLVQDKPRENYKLRSVVAMLPGTTFPQAAKDPADVKTIQKDADKSLVQSPESALAALADVLTKKKSKFAPQVAENTFVEQITGFQKEQIKSNGNAEISFSHTVVEDNTRALRTAGGGALVFGYLSNNMTSTPKEEGGTVKLDKDYAALAGGDSSSDGVSITFGESVMLYVPPAGSGKKVQVIGAAQDLIDAKLMK